MTLLRTAAMASLKQENNVTAATHLLRSDHFHHHHHHHHHCHHCHRRRHRHLFNATEKE